MKLFHKKKPEPVRTTRVVRNGHGRYIVQQRAYRQRTDGSLHLYWQDATSRREFALITDAFKRAEELDGQAEYEVQSERRIPLSASDYEDA